LSESVGITSKHLHQSNPWRNFKKQLICIAVSKQPKKTLIHQNSKLLPVRCTTLTIVVKEEKVDLNIAISCLGPALTNEDDMIRSKGYQCVNTVIQNVPVTSVTAQSLSHLSKFLSNRLHDMMCFNDLLPCVHTMLSRFPTLLEDDMAFFLIQLFSEVSVRSLTQPSRKLIFQILSFLIDKFPKSIFSFFDI
jgi:hypothetical protein